MRFLSTTIYLLCFMMNANGDLKFNSYCYDSPELNCTNHTLDCGKNLITTETSSFYVGFLKNKFIPECQTKQDECQVNMTDCCRFINSSVTKQVITLTADNNTPLVNFIKTECSFKSSCIVSLYYNTSGGSDLYDVVTYNYGCIPALKDNITANFLVNSTQFIGKKFPTLYYLDYTGNRSKEDDVVILNRECIVTTTKGDITLTIKEFNLQADDCCRFHITRYNVSEYCSQNGSFIPPKGRSLGKNSATIRLENVVIKDGDSFSIIVQAAGNVTVDCRTIKHNNKQGPITCQQPTPQSSSTSESTISITSPPVTQTKESIRESTIENKEKIYSESDLAVIIGGTVGGLVLLNIIVIIIVVVIVRRKLRTKPTTNETQYYSSLDGLSPEHNYSGMETTTSPRA